MKRRQWLPLYKRGPRFSRRKMRQAVEESLARDPNLTKDIIAISAGVSHSTFYNYLRATRKDGKPAPEPTATVLFRLAEILRKDPSFFME